MISPECLTHLKSAKRYLELQTTFKGDDRLLEELINAATALINRLTNRNLKFKKNVVEITQSRDTNRLFLKRTPVHAINTIWVSKSQDWTDTYKLDADDYRFDSKTGLVVRLDGKFPSYPKSVKIDYNGGFSEFPISETNNVITVVEDTTETQVEIDPGVYTADELATEITNKLTSSLTQTYTCGYDSTKQLFTITGTGVFTLKFSLTTSSIAELIGFGDKDYSGSTSYTSEFPVLGVPQDLIAAANILVAWLYKLQRENLLGVVSESRGDVSQTFNVQDIPVSAMRVIKRYRRVSV